MAGLADLAICLQRLFAGAVTGVFLVDPVDACGMYRHELVHCVAGAIAALPISTGRFHHNSFALGVVATWQLLNCIRCCPYASNSGTVVC